MKRLMQEESCEEFWQTIAVELTYWFSLNWRNKVIVTIPSKRLKRQVFRIQDASSLNISNSQTFSVKCSE